MEALLHYVWRHRLFPSSQLLTTGGQEVEVMAPGVPNRDAGPDFFNAMLRVGGTLWAGNVELHVKASQWVQHGHHLDPVYDNTILHVVAVHDGDAVTSDGKLLPVLVLPIPRALRDNYATLLRTDDYPRCHEIISTLPRLTVNSWMSALLVERMQQRSAMVHQRAGLESNDWEHAFFITLARSFGFGKNGDAFELWARKLPLSAVARHRDDLELVEAMFLGTAGLLNPGSLPRAHRDAGVADLYFARLQRQYDYMCHKFGLTSIDGSVWRFMRLRPSMFPHVKLAQLASLFSQERATLSRMVHLAMSGDVDEVVRAMCDELRVPVSQYWQHHYVFGLEAPHSLKQLSPSSVRLIVINAIVPTLWAYAAHRQQQDLQQRAMALLEQFPAEDNHIMRQWQACGLTVTSAADSQALLHLKRTRCDTYDCLHCRFGYYYLKKK